MTEIEAFVILASLPGLGSAKIRELVRFYGSALECLKIPSQELKKYPGFERIALNWNQLLEESKWKEELDLIHRYQIQLIPFTSPNYPLPLLQIPDPPSLLYVKGDLKKQDARSFAIVGTRQASIYGMEMADKISQTLAGYGFTIVSGLARGIDTAAHQGAIQKGRTLAVIGSGLAKIYPIENQSLAHRISSCGALISEFPMATPPDRQNFPRRNRIVSGLTLGTVLIEAPIQSGAMLTMEKAHCHKRKLFALPGRADNENFRGNHALIRSGKAQLIESAEDIMVHFDGLFPLNDVQIIDNQRPILDTEETCLLEKMPNEEFTIDEFSLLTNLPIHHIHRILMSLVLKKAVKEFPGKIYKKISCRKQ